MFMSIRAIIYPYLLIYPYLFLLASVPISPCSFTLKQILVSIKYISLFISDFQVSDFLTVFCSCLCSNMIA